jgi:SEC-C motif-containing protein
VTPSADSTAPTPSWPTLADGGRCPCLSGLTYGECCAPFHRGEGAAPTAERLMRSRYSAFVVGDAAYLLRTHHPSTRPASLELDPNVRWYRLDILGRSLGGILDTQGEVEFRARYRFDGEAGDQHERSKFVRDRGAWSYVSAV